MSCSHPGKILLQQYLQPQKLSQNRLARAIKVPPRRINEIIHEKRGITADTAVRLAIYFGNSASDWMQLQAAFDIDKIKPDIAIQLNGMPSRAENEITRAANKEATGPDNTKPANPRPVYSVKKRIMR